MFCMGLFSIRPVHLHTRFSKAPSVLFGRQLFLVTTDSLLGSFDLCPCLLAEIEGFSDSKMLVRS